MAGEAMKSLADNPGPVVGGGMLFPGIAPGSGVVVPGVVGGGIQPSAAGTSEIARMLLNRSAEAQQTDVPSSGTVPGGTSGMMDDAVSQPSVQSAQDSFEQRARKIKFLVDNGMITQEQYQEKIAQLMSEI